jgi:hypothetical protein
MATEGDTWRPAVGRSTDDGSSVRRDPTEEATSVSAPVHSSERGEALRVLRNKIEAAVWVLSACGVGYYGDGDSHMLKVALLDAAVKRCAAETTRHANEKWCCFTAGCMLTTVHITHRTRTTRRSCSRPTR